MTSSQIRTLLIYIRLCRADTPLNVANTIRPALLSDLAKGECAAVVALDDTAEGVVIAQRLRDLGFVPGATCEVVARMSPGGDPMAVRVAGSTFALRRREAGVIAVQRHTLADDARAPLPQP